jgi:uncharacterized membrane protein YesL
MNKRLLFIGIDSIFKNIFFLAKSNIYFILFSLRGGIVLGVFPALVSLLETIRVYDMEESSFTIKSIFREKYKIKWKEANIVGWILTLVGIALYSNYVILINNLGKYSFYTTFSYFVLLYIYFSVAVWVFPLVLFKKDSIVKQLLNSIIIGVVYFPYTLTLFAILFLSLYLSLQFPSLLLFFTGSAISFLVLLISKKPLSDVTNTVT